MWELFCVGCVCYRGVLRAKERSDSSGTATASAQWTPAPCKAQREERLQTVRQGETQKHPDQPGQTQLRDLQGYICKCTSKVFSIHTAFLFWSFFSFLRFLFFLCVKGQWADTKGGGVFWAEWQWEESERSPSSAATGSLHRVLSRSILNSNLNQISFIASLSYWKPGFPKCRVRDGTAGVC